MEDEIDYGELFGVTPDDGGGVPNPGTGGQEPAGQQEPAAPESGQGQGQPSAPEGAGDDNVPNPGTGGQALAEQQEPAAPEGGQGQGQPSAPENAESGNVPNPGTPQGAEQVQADAQARAQYEAAVAKAQADAQRAIDEAFARSGLKNPYTGQPITTKAEYDAYRERFESERREKILKQTGMSGEEFQQFVQELPEVRKAREAQEAAEKAVREAQEAAARVKIDEQLREIGQLDPSIKTLEDLSKMPTYQKFYELVQRGNNFVDAFRLANFEALTQSAAAGARQAAVNAALGKEHLEPTKTRGTGGVSVPAEVKAQYKLFNPDATDEEIQKHYQRNHKEP